MTPPPADGNQIPCATKLHILLYTTTHEKTDNSKCRCIRRTCIGTLKSAHSVSLNESAMHFQHTRWRNSAIGGYSPR